MGIQVSKESTGIVNFEDLERGFGLWKPIKQGRLQEKNQ